LNDRGNYGLTVDGDCGPKTIKAIKAFQATLGGFKPDGLITPGKSTARALGLGGGSYDKGSGEGAYGKGGGGGGGGGYGKGGGGGGDYGKGGGEGGYGGGGGGGGGDYGKGGGGGDYRGSGGSDNYVGAGQENSATGQSGTGSEIVNDPGTKEPEGVVDKLKKAAEGLLGGD
jgi:hypothetical protein